MTIANEQENVAQALGKTLGAKAITVLQAARKVFLAHGFSNATTDMIQREAGVSKSTVYAHFANKETLFSAVVQTECFSTSTSMRTIRYKPGQLRDVLRKVANVYLNVVLSKSGAALARMVIAEVERFPNLGKIFYESGPRASIKVVANIIVSANEAGDLELGSLTSEEAARIFIGSVRSELQLYYLTHPDDMPTKAQKEQWITLIVDTFTRAYGKSA
ncbi:TetR/AcrR family transcriptional regulator [Alteromonas lipotrueae]|uniref:TetR/AcrR family transcriptional regulator n=1 Tax=Alteromonas lipotrueae TaxID=2803814 RepID=UPI001C450E1F|nr:TetR/AcrR family transcriptional regulator [Alteromonas lipotrueae]